MAGICELSRMWSAGTRSVISYPIGDSGQELILTDTILDHLKRYRQRTPGSREAGGQLFARFEDARVSIERATGPNPSDQRTLFTFSPNRLVERREIKRLFEVGLHYVGDWHTHPEAHPCPSDTDIHSFQEMFQQSRHKLASFVMIIVGNAGFPDGLFVALCDGGGIKPLTLGQVSSNTKGRRSASSRDNHRNQ